MKAISLFSSAGIGELLLSDLDIQVVLANEIADKRASFYTFLYPDVHMVTGDIRDTKVKSKILDYSMNCDLLIATPPCQGISTLGKNKLQNQYIKDERNYLIFDLLTIIDNSDFSYILIENVPKYLEMFFPYQGSYVRILDILKDKYSDRYTIDADVLNVEEYGVPQSRPRAIIRLYKKDLSWILPKKEKKVDLNQAIGHLPSLESGESSPIKYHTAKSINARYINSLRHTPEGKSALENEIHYPKKENGERIKGFHNTFKRMLWNKPAPARTTYCGNVNSHNNVHPGRINSDGTQSDARPLTLLETLIVSSIPIDIVFPEWASETFIYTMIGEGVPPLFMKKVLATLV